MPPVEPTLPTTVARRSLRLRSKQSTDEPQEPLHQAHTQTTPVANKQPQPDAYNRITTSEEDKTARMIAVDCLLRLQYTDKSHLKYSSLVARAAPVVSTSTPRVITAHQSDKNRNEKENGSALLSKRTTDATHVATNALTKVPLTSKTQKPMKATATTTSRRAQTNTLKRKATDDAPEANGPSADARNFEARAVKRPRTKFTAEPSERVMRSSRSKVEVAGTSTEKIPTQQQATEVGLTEKVIASTGADKSTANSDIEGHSQATDSPADSKALDNTDTLVQIERPRLVLVIPARALSTATESTPTAAGSGLGYATRTATASPVESVVTATEAEAENEVKALSPANDEPSAARRVRVPGGKGIKSTA